MDERKRLASLKQDWLSSEDDNKQAIEVPNRNTTKNKQLLLDVLAVLGPLMGTLVDNVLCSLWPVLKVCVHVH